MDEMTCALVEKVAELIEDRTLGFLLLRCPSSFCLIHELETLYPATALDFEMGQTCICVAQGSSHAVPDNTECFGDDKSNMQLITAWSFFEVLENTLA